MDFETAEFALRQSWEVHRQAFGPILEPAFAENQQVRILVINALNHISRRDIKRGMELLKEIQPQDMDEDDVLPDPTVYDALRFLVKDLEADGKVDCPCHKGEYDLRFSPDGIQVFCPDCGAVYTFKLHSEHAHEDYLALDEIKLR